MKKLVYLLLLFLIPFVCSAAGLDDRTTLLLHLNGADGAQATSDSSDFNHTINFQNEAQLDTAEKKFGSASVLLDGAGDNLNIVDSPAFDIVADNSDDWTIDLWVKHADHTGLEAYIGQEEDLENRWRLFHNDGIGIRFQVESLNVIEINISTGGEIMDTDFHHIALIKVGSKYGSYKDGVQVGFIEKTFTDTYAGALYIGMNSTVGGSFQGHMDEVRIHHWNYFAAVPNSGLTNKIRVPTAEYDANRTSKGVIFVK